MAEPVILYKGSEARTVNTIGAAAELEADGWTRTRPAGNVVATVTQADALRVQEANAPRKSETAKLDKAVEEAKADADAPLTIERKSAKGK